MPKILKMSPVWPKMKTQKWPKRLKIARSGCTGCEEDFTIGKICHLSQNASHLVKPHLDSVNELGRPHGLNVKVRRSLKLL